jgi:hypothetical protein
MSVNQSALAGYRRALEARGELVKFQRVTGTAPNTASFYATVMAIVSGYQADSQVMARTGYAAGSVGAITQGDRTILVLASDLANENFPLPLKKNDKVTVIASNEYLNIVQVDPSKRNVAGCIELKAAGVA